VRIIKEIRMREQLQHDGVDFEVTYIEFGIEKTDFVGIDEARQLRRLANIQSTFLVPN